MKKALLATLLLTALSAHATDRNPHAQAGATALGIGVGIGGSSSATGGSSTATGQGGSLNYEDKREIPVTPPAIAPNPSNHLICPMVMQGSKSFSVFLFSVSKTTEPILVPICVAYHLDQPDVVEAMTCNASKEYREANPKCPKTP